MGRVMDCSTFVFDSSCRFLCVDAAAERHSGYSREHLLLMRPWDLKPEFSPQRFGALVRPLFSGQVEDLRLDTVHRRADGALIPVHIWLRRLPRAEGPLALAIVQEDLSRDLSHRVRREAIRWQNLDVGKVDRQSALCWIAANMTETAALVDEDPAAAKANMIRLAGYFKSLSSQA